MHCNVQRHYDNAPGSARTFLHHEGQSKCEQTMESLMAQSDKRDPLYEARLKEIFGGGLSDSAARRVAAMPPRPPERCTVHTAQAVSPVVDAADRFDSAG